MVDRGKSLPSMPLWVLFLVVACCCRVSPGYSAQIRGTQGDVIPSKIAQLNISGPFALEPYSQIAPVCEIPGPARVLVYSADLRKTTWKGWGTSLAWFANFIGNLPIDQLGVLLDLLFSKDSGLGLNIVRYNIGGGFNPQNSPQFEVPTAMRYRGMPGFKPDEYGNYNWTLDEAQRAVLLGAKERGADTFVAFSNSPPWWMTISGDVAGGVGGVSNLKPDYFQAFADYLSDVVEQYANNADWNITFQYLEPFNEPEGRRRKGGTQEGCHFSSEEMSRLIPMVNQSLERRGLETKLSAFDGVPIATIDLIKTTPPEVMDQISALHVHGYETTRSVDRLHSTARDFSNTAAAAAKVEKELWVSEWGPAAADEQSRLLEPAGDLVVALFMGRMIMESVNVMGASAWVYWQAIDSSPLWTLIQLSSWGVTQAFPYALTKKFHVLRQFAAFVPPGSVSIALQSDNECQYCTVAFYDPCGLRLVFYVVNQRPTAQSIALSLSGFRIALRSSPFWYEIIRTSALEDMKIFPKTRLAYNPNSPSELSLSAMGRSLTTVLVYNVAPPLGSPACTVQD